MESGGGKFNYTKCDTDSRPDAEHIRELEEIVDTPAGLVSRVYRGPRQLRVVIPYSHFVSRFWAASLLALSWMLAYVVHRTYNLIINAHLGYVLLVVATNIAIIALWKFLARFSYRVLEISGDRFRIIPGWLIRKGHTPIDDRKGNNWRQLTRGPELTKETWHDKHGARHDMSAIQFTEGVQTYAYGKNLTFLELQWLLEMVNQTVALPLGD